MRGSPRGSGQRSNLYSGQRFTNWSPHDPYWGEVETLPSKMRPRAEVARSEEAPLGVFDRPLTEGFLRPWSVDDVITVLRAVPEQYLSDLTAVFLLGGTTRQRRLKKITYGMYSANQIFLFALSEPRLTLIWSAMPKPSLAQRYEQFGVTITSLGNGKAKVQFDEASLRRFYLYDVLLHELGHHVDRDHRAGDAERYAKWFAEFQRARLQER
jgi:hypothetical protein